TADVRAVCFDAPTVELLSAAREREHHALRHLGPDVLGDGFDTHEARRRLRARGGFESGAAPPHHPAPAGLRGGLHAGVLRRWRGWSRPPRGPATAWSRPRRG